MIWVYQNELNNVSSVVVFIRRNGEFWLCYDFWALFGFVNSNSLKIGQIFVSIVELVLSLGGWSFNLSLFI